MARQSGVIQFRGKLGRVVGMNNGFDETSNKVNFLREKVEVMNNPQSDPQMDQRAKMLPAVLFRRQLMEVISRAWEGVKYGGPSTRLFMKYALKEPWANVPQLPKDSTLPIPGAYLISKGSLPTIGVSINVDPQVQPTGEVVTTLQISTYQGSTDTVGDLSTDLIENNSFLREGDQLTFIRVSAPSADIPYIIYNVASLYLDTASTTTVEEAMGTAVSLINLDDSLSVDAAIPGQPITLAGAVVLSRDGATTAQRSTQRMVLNTSALTAYFANALKASIADTYRTTEASRSTDWPYQEGGEGASGSGYVTINLSATPAAGGSVTGGGRYAEGDTVTLVATPAQGYSFVGWSSGGTTLSTSTTYTFVASASMSIVAEFSDEDRP